MSPTQITQERNAEYQDAWKYTGEVCSHTHIGQGLDNLLVNYSFAWYPWIIILNKLIRILGSPTKLDHWDDIIGYATLVRDYLTSKEEQ